MTSPVTASEAEASPEWKSRKRPVFLGACLHQDEAGAPSALECAAAESDSLVGAPCVSALQTRFASRAAWECSAKREVVAS
jgi:hypothetical protein